MYFFHLFCCFSIFGCWNFHIVGRPTYANRPPPGVAWRGVRREGREVGRRRWVIDVCAALLGRKSAERWVVGGKRHCVLVVVAAMSRTVIAVGAGVVAFASAVGADVLGRTAGLLFLCIGAVYIVWVAYWFFLCKPVGDPGGPKEKSQYRLPAFADRDVPAPSGWKFACASASHFITEGEGGPALLGEPAGRQIWYYDPDNTADTMHTTFNATENPNSADRLFRAQQIERTPPRSPYRSKPGTVAEAARRAVEFYEQLQCSDGHWAGDYGGPMFLMPGLIITAYVTESGSAILTAAHRAAMVHYLRNHQQLDGGWGTHIESPSTMFGSCMSYVSMRLLGVAADDPACIQGRAFIRKHGGAVFTSSWAKFWFAALGIYDWKGINSVPAEMWLLPKWFPFHPGRLWCHCRMVYLPMCYIYGRRFVYRHAETDPLILALRDEMYPEPYSTIDWGTSRHKVAAMDNYSPIHPVMKIAHDVLAIYENHWATKDGFLRKQGLQYAMDYIHAEDEQTNYVDIGPVNKAMNMLCVFIDAGGETDPSMAVGSMPFQKHVQRVPDYLWVAEDGMKMQGYNGSQCWDTCFAIQAVAEAGLCPTFPSLTRKVWGFLERTQILSTETSQSSPAFSYESPSLRDKFFRHVSKGGWPFSTAAHGWPISDCTAEGLKSVLALREMQCIQDGDTQGIDDERLFDAVTVLLTLQNSDGGWATYENNRGYGWYEILNPSEVFGDIMIDYPYVECSSASVTALVKFREAFPTHRAIEVDSAIRSGVAFMKSIQRGDGSWYGSWGCCFTYGTWFGIEGLVAAGENPRTSSAIQTACTFLLDHQLENGGWGEDFTSCYDKSYAAEGAKLWGDEGSAVIQTAWALLGLMAADCPQTERVERGIRFLMRKQLSNGDWNQEGITGVFNRACGITYTAYRNVFPLWALGKYASHYSRRRK